MLIDGGISLLVRGSGGLFRGRRRGIPNVLIIALLAAASWVLTLSLLWLIWWAL